DRPWSATRAQRFRQVIFSTSAPRAAALLCDRRTSRSPCQRGHRRHPSPRYAARIGRRAIAARDLVGSRRPQQQRASIFRYSAPNQPDRPDMDFDRVGRVGVPVFEELGAALPDAAFYICSPAAFMSDLVDGLAGWGVACDRLHTENFGSGQSMTPGIAA